MIDFELAILNALQGLHFPALDFVMKCVTHLGDWGWFFILITLLMLCFKKTRIYGAVCATALVFDVLAVNIIIKPLAARIRPYDINPDVLLLIAREIDFSFPSGHTAVACAFAMSIGAYSPKYRLWAFILAALIAFSRLYLYMHFPTDVLAGAAIGTLCGYIALRIWKKRLSRGESK